MGDLILYLGVTFVGFILGGKVREHKEKFSWTARVQMVALIILVMVMGMRMGSNEEVIANLSTIGISAVLMTAVIMICSILAIWLARQAMGIDRYGRMKAAEADVLTDAGKKNTGSADTADSAGSNSTTVAIIASVAAGMALGYLVIRRVFEGNMEQFDSLAGLAIKIGLCLLLVFIGLDLGLDGTVVDNLKK